MKKAALLCVVLAAALLIGACDASSITNVAPTPWDFPPPPQTEPPQPPQTEPPQWGRQTKTSGCAVAGPLPDSACTPGDIFPQATRNDICTPGYSRSVRDVPVSVKDQVYAAYGIARHTPGQYEVDHLVSLELGGSNSIANLWPEAASPNPGFHEKDEVENYLHDQVCNGAMPIQEAQREIAQNWLAVYQQLHGEAGVPIAPPAAATPIPAPAARATAPAQTSGGVSPTGGTCPTGYPIKGNIRSDGVKIYHPPGDPSYERTRPERCFATAADAEAAGFRAPR